MKNGQTWSIDLIIGVIIFMMIIAVFYAFLIAKSDEGLEGLKDDARAVNSKIGNAEEIATNIISEGNINESRYTELCRYEYETIKSMLGMENDFCIYLEDEEGGAIPCVNNDGEDQIGIGNGEDIVLYIDDAGQEVHCGDTA